MVACVPIIASSTIAFYRAEIICVAVDRRVPYRGSKWLMLKAFRTREREIEEGKRDHEALRVITWSVNAV